MSKDTHNTNVEIYNMKETLWDYIRKFYLDKFGITSDLVDLMSSLDVIIMCAAGASNGSISKKLEIDCSEIQDILISTTEFSGWDHDLEVNPLFILSNISNLTYSKDYNLFKIFKHNVLAHHAYSDDDIGTMFRVCTMYESIMTRLEREWV